MNVASLLSFNELLKVFGMLTWLDFNQSSVVSGRVFCSATNSSSSFDSLIDIRVFAISLVEGDPGALSRNFAIFSPCHELVSLDVFFGSSCSELIASLVTREAVIRGEKRLWEKIRDNERLYLVTREGK